MTLGPASSRSSERGTVPAMEIEQYSSTASKYFDVGEEYWVYTLFIANIDNLRTKIQTKKVHQTNEWTDGPNLRPTHRTLTSNIAKDQCGSLH